MWQGAGRAHARTGDPAVLTGYMGKSSAFEDAIAEFSVAYADQNEHDHASLLDAIRSGRMRRVQLNEDCRSPDG